MKHLPFKTSIYLVSVLTLVLTFSVFYQDNHEFFGSLWAALMAAVLVYGALLMISCLIQVFYEK